MTTKTTWTHTATLAKTYAVGAKQLGFTAKAGETVTLIQDPAKQDGEFITFRHGRSQGVARISDLRNIEAK